MHLVPRSPPQILQPTFAFSPFVSPRPARLVEARLQLVFASKADVLSLAMSLCGDRRSVKHCYITAQPLGKSIYKEMAHGLASLLLKAKRDPKPPTQVTCQHVLGGNHSRIVKTNALGTA